MEEFDYREVYPKWFRMAGIITMMLMLGVLMFALHNSEHKLADYKIYCAEHHISDTVALSYQLKIDSLSHENDSLKKVIAANPVQNFSRNVRNTKAKANIDLMQFVKWLVTDDVQNQRVEIHHYNH